MNSPKTSKFLNQEVINRYKDFGGVRIESDVVFLHLLLNLIKDNLVFSLSFLYYILVFILSFLNPVTTYTYSILYSTLNPKNIRLNCILNYKFHMIFLFFNKRSRDICN